MRAVIDTNVHISALIGAGPPARIIDNWLTRPRFEMIVCPLLLDKVSEVASRRHLRARLRTDLVNAYLRLLVAGAIQMPDPDAIVQTTRDRQDDYLVALAQQAHADVIVTGDKDLLEWEGQVPRVVTPATLEEMLLDDAL